MNLRLGEFAPPFADRNRSNPPCPVIDIFEEPTMQKAEMVEVEGLTKPPLRKRKLAPERDAAFDHAKLVGIADSEPV